MNKLNYFHRVLLLFIAVILFNPAAEAQNCRIDLLPGGSSTFCAPRTVTLRAVNTDPTKTPVQWAWQFGDNSNSQNPFSDSVVVHSYTKCSSDTTIFYRPIVTITYSDASKCQVSYNDIIKVWCKPTAQITLPAQTTQCFLNNNFCFADASQPSTQKWQIVSRLWDFGDGQFSTQTNPCHHYDQPGTYTISLQIVDTQGCQDLQVITSKIVVLKEIAPSFTVNAPIACFQTTGVFKNTTDTTNLHIKNVIWDFGDGTPPVSNPANWDSISHVYTYDTLNLNGEFTPKVIIETKEGCRDEFQLKNAVVIFYYKLKIKFDDYPCNAVAAGDGIRFEFPGLDKAGFTNYFWTFDDPPSGPQNIAFNDPAPQHKFVSGPKNYQIKFFGIHPYCGVVDTCFILHVNGPVATINLSPPVVPVKYATYRAPKLIKNRQAYFKQLIYGDTVCSQVKAGTSAAIPYIVYSTPTTTQKWVYKYCNATVTDSVTTDTLCSPDPPQVVYNYKIKSIQPSDSVLVTVKDSVPTTLYYNIPARSGIPKDSSAKLSGLPTAPRIYTPATGVKLDQNMGDSNVFSCEFPNLVRFVNNSSKFRARNNTGVDKYGAKDFPGTKYSFTSYDNSYPGYTTNPDSCLNPNYPYASDSLEYLWDFADDGPAAKSCTTYVITPNQGVNWKTFANIGMTPTIAGATPLDCNYSRIGAPWHFYRRLSMKDPEKPCYSVTMKVFDPVTGCEGQASEQIRMGKPDAGWDKKAFCEMNWYIQQTFAGSKQRKGFKFINQSTPCANDVVKYGLNLEETLPAACGSPEKWWVTFDSTFYTWDDPDKSEGKYNTANHKCYYNYRYNVNNKLIWDTAYTYGFTNNDRYGGDNSYFGNPPWLNRFWYQETDSGAKTLGLVIKNGNCYDTAWYHDYIKFNLLATPIRLLDSSSNKELVADIWHKDITDIDDPLGPYRPALQLLSPQRPDGNVRYLSGATGVKADPTNPFRPGHISMAASVKIAPIYTKQDYITLFRYDVSRYRLRSPYANGSGNQFDDYYDMKPFWPDSLTLDPIPGAVNLKDSITAQKFKGIVLHDSIVSNNDTILFIKLFNNQTQLNDTFRVRNTGFDFYLLENEVLDLNATGVAKIPVSDQRARRLGKACDDTSSYIPIYTKVRPVPIKDTVRVYDLNQEEKDYTTFVDGIPQKDTAVFKLPYPGVYRVIVSATNIDGCGAISDPEYKIINGHFAKFDLGPKPDSVKCVGATVKFYDKVRYFGTQCPTPPGGLDPFDVCFHGLLGIGDLAPWDTNYVTARMMLAPRSYIPPIPETMAWDFEDDGIIDATTHNPTWSYSSPGVYSVALYTTDSNGYTVKTLRKNFIKVINVQTKVALKNPADTFGVCAPQNIVFVDSTDISKGQNTYFVGKNKFAFKDKVFGKCPDPNKPGKFIKCIKDTIVVYDSIQLVTWNWGDGTQPITTFYRDTAMHAYLKNDTFDLAVRTITKLGCKDSIRKDNFLIIKGPQPRFSILGKKRGCLPLQVKVENKNLNGFNYKWLKGDGTTANSSSKDKFVDLIFDHMDPADFAAGKDSSRFLIQVTQEDTIFDPKQNKYVSCSVTWPDPVKDAAILDSYYVWVYRTDSVRVVGDTVVCPDKPANLQVKSKTNSNLGIFKEYNWSFGDGTVLNNTTESALSHVYSKPGVYTVKVNATTKKDCPITGDSMKVRVEGVAAEFDFDSTSGRLGNFCFTNKSKFEKVDENALRFVWTFSDIDAPLPFDTRETKGLSETLCYNFEPRISPNEKDTIFRYKVCLKALSPNGCDKDTCREVVFIRSFETYNVITPNGDGQNDKFDPKVNGEKIYDLVIFNRWGEKVFESKDPNADWDGTNFNDGKGVPAGTYYYILKYHFIGQQENKMGKDAGKPRTGTITVIR